MTVTAGAPPGAPKPDRRPEPSPAMSTVHWHARRLPVSAAWAVRSSPAAHPWAVISAGLAPILLTGAYLISGILQPASYSPVRTTISAMADRREPTGGS